MLHSSLDQRSLQPEVMDQPDLAAHRHHAALRSLGRLNVVSGAAVVVAGLLRQVLRQDPPGDRALRVLDVATGGADVPIALQRRAACSSADWQVDGCDISETALAYARQRIDRAGLLQPPQLFRCDVLHDPMPKGYDVMVFSLFLHHLSDEQVITVLQKAGRASRWIAVNDLKRSRLNLAAVSAAAHLLSRSDVVHTDAALSVRAAFTVDELADLARTAGLDVCFVRPRFPARLVMLARSR